VNGHYFKCCIAESFVKVSILPYVGSVCYLSRQICFGSPDFSGADALIAAVGRTVSCRGNHNAAAATPVLYTVGFIQLTLTFTHTFQNLSFSLF
jgi:hypothetical protein